jgi:thymidylate synthase
MSEYAYLDLVADILEYGDRVEDRTGTGTISSFGHQMYFDISESFPLLTTKLVSFKLVATELLWFLNAKNKTELNVKDLQKMGNNIWNEWASETGNLGPIYGVQWRNWLGRDQIENVIQSIKNNPRSRRHIVSAWNVGELEYMALPPCHLLYQFYVSSAGRLDCQLYQRSADMFLGVPFNIASYSLLTYMIAHLTGLRPGRFIWTGGDCHIYLNHIEQVREQLSRQPHLPPKLEIKGDIQTIDDFSMLNFKLHDYIHHPRIVGEISV